MKTTILGAIGAYPNVYLAAAGLLFAAHAIAAISEHSYVSQALLILGGL